MKTILTILLFISFASSAQSDKLKKFMASIDSSIGDKTFHEQIFVIGKQDTVFNSWADCDGNRLQSIVKIFSYEYKGKKCIDTNYLYVDSNQIKSKCKLIK